MKILNSIVLVLVLLTSGMVFGSNTSSHAYSSSDLAGGNLKLEIIDMGDPNDKPTIQCIVKGKTCTIVDTSK